MNDAEFIVKTSMNALGDFLGEQFGDTIQKEFNKMFENWEVAWNIIKKMLIEIPITDRNNTLLYIVEHYLPSYRENVTTYIETLFSLHDDFWNCFFYNLLEAKKQIS